MTLKILMNIFFTITFSFIISSLYSLPSHASDTSQLDRALRAIQKEHQIPAMSVAVIRSGKLVFSKGYGFTDEEKYEAASADTTFRAASISKLFTAQAIIQLSQAGKLSLEDPVAKYLRAFDNKSVTIKKLLTHSSGLKDSIKPKSGKAQRSKVEYLRVLDDNLKSAGSSKLFNYSDGGFNLLGMVVETVTGVSYEESIAQTILRPLGMNNSGYFNSRIGQLAKAQPTHKGVVIAEGKRRAHSGVFNPSEGLVSNAKDLGAWLKATMEHSSILLRPEAYQAMLEPQIKTSWGEIYMGLGWQVYIDGGIKVARHPGSVRGYKSLILMYPESQNGLVILTNSSKAPRWLLANSIIEILGLKEASPKLVDKKIMQEKTNISQ